MPDYREVMRYTVRKLISGLEDIPEWSPWRLLEGVEADDRAGQHRQGVEAFGVTFVADAEPPPATKPCSGALDGPAVATEGRRGLDHAAGDSRADPSPA